MATITGTSGNDNLVGTNDDDRIIGGAGADTLTGNDGRDEFFLVPGEDLDRITDLTQEDTITLLTSDNGFRQGDLTVSVSGGDTRLRLDRPNDQFVVTGVTLTGTAGFDAGNFVVVPSVVFRDFADDALDQYIINGTRIFLTDAGGGTTTGLGRAGNASLTFGTDA